jgi:hypothetical protein
VAVLLCGLLGYLLGLRDAALIVFIFFLWIPIGILVLSGAYVISTPKIEPYYPDYLELNPRG